MFLQYAKYILVAVGIYTYGITAFATYQMFGFNGLALHFAIAVGAGLYFNKKGGSSERL